MTARRGFARALRPGNKTRQNVLVRILFIVQCLLGIILPAVAQDIPKSGLRLWLRADKGVTVDSSSFRWADQSGNNAHATQASASSRPTVVANAVKGLPAVRFDGVDDHLMFTSNIDGLSALTMILVSSSAQNPTDNLAGVEKAPLMWGEYSSWGSVYLSPYQSSVHFRFGTGEANNWQVYKRPQSIGTNYSLSTAIKDGTLERLFVQGQEVYRRNAPNAKLKGISSAGRVGRGNKYFAGSVAEVLVYARALSDSERAAVEAYLMSKYFGSSPAPTPDNKAPVVNAGPDLTIAVSATAELRGSVTDDGKPSNKLTIAWSKVSGPGNVTFANASSPTTTAQFSAAGSYVLRLTASDGALSASDDVSVTVTTATGGGSQPTPSGVAIYPGTNIQSVVDRHPEGTRFIIKAGVHRMQTVVPKNRQIFTGEPGAIMTGAKVLTNWHREGSLWYVDGQTQQGALSNGECEPAYPRCRYTEDLYYDGKPLRHVASKGEVGPGKWFFDYNADRIYMADDPNGHLVETSVTRFAFRGFATDVIIEGLTVEKYASPAQQGAIGGEQNPPAGWIVRNNTVRWNHGLGIKIGTRGKVLNNLVVYNGQMGINIGEGEDQLVEGNEIAYSNWAGYMMGWEAGGAKFANTIRLVVRNNYSHDNYGGGLWTDINNIHTLYEGNRVIRNAGAGLAHEISYDAIIRNNICEENGYGANSWLWGAQIQIQDSQNTQVYGNKVVVAASGGNGIALIQQNRGTGRYGPYVTANNHVYNNEITYRGNKGGSGAVADHNNQAFFNSGNKFEKNKYHTPNLNNRHWAWFDGWWTWNEIQSKGVDIGSTADTNVK